MCGLVGVAGDLWKQDKDAFADLLVMDSLRGSHSTGIAAVDRKGLHRIHKRAMNPFDYMSTRDYGSIITHGTAVLMGHNRYATVGNIDNLSAHPFEAGGLIGAHNGTLRGWRKLMDSEEFDVDSECLVHNLALEGFEKVIPKLEGAWALSVYDVDEKTLQFIRNKERPLWFAYRKDFKALYWASEAWMLDSATERRGVKLADDPFQLRTDTLLTWDLKDTTTPIQKPQAVKIAGATPPPPPAKFPPYHTGKPHNVTYLERDKMRERLGEWIRIVPIEVGVGLTGSPYLAAVEGEAPFADAQCYCNPQRIDRLLQMNECMGRICGVARNQDGPYFIIDAASIVEHEEEEDDIPFAEDIPEDVKDLTVGPNDRLIDEKEFDVLAKHGCGICCGDVFFEDDLEWRLDAPICMKCQEVENVTSDSIIYLGERG